MVCEFYYKKGGGSETTLTSEQKVPNGGWGQGSESPRDLLTSVQYTVFRGRAGGPACGLAVGRMGDEPQRPPHSRQKHTSLLVVTTHSRGYNDVKIRILHTYSNLPPLRISNFVLYYLGKNAGETLLI